MMSKILSIAEGLQNPKLAANLSKIWSKKYIELTYQKSIEQIDKHQELTHFKPILTYNDNFLREWVTHPTTAHSILHYKKSKSKEKGVSSGLTDILWLNSSKNNSDLLEYYKEYDLRKFHNMILDLKSDFHIPPRGDHFGSLQFPNNPESIINKLDKSLIALKGICQYSYDFITLSTIYLCIRTEKDAPTSFSSCSFSGYSGFTLLINIMQNRIDIPKLIDALYHEAIHAILYFYEESQTMLLNNRPENNIRVKSPWSGRNLGTDQFVQACFVWWGLYNLWRNLRGKENISEKRQKFFYERSLLGFSKNPYSILKKSEASKYVNEEVLHAINYISKKFI